MTLDAPRSTRFIADVMLGSLARWLRILGYDTLYFRAIDDNELIKMARQQERILLTRDTGIARRNLKKKDRGSVESESRRKVGPDVILIHSNDTLEQLKEVLYVLGIMNQGKGDSENRSERLFPDSPIPRFPVSDVLSDVLPQLSPRCTLCNGELAATERNAVADRIPEYVFLNAASFFSCKECGKVYWCGSHKKSIDSILKQLKQVIGDGS